MSQPSQVLDVATIPLDGVNLIEASAGTGKTYTITGLYLRLLLEAGYPLEQILVMTYTEAATKELRERIWGRLLEAKAAFATGQSEDALLQALLETLSERGEVLQRLEQALRGFDEAAIFTIHGYCKRALDEAAFESGQGFESELVGEQPELLEEIVEDFWRCHFAHLSRLEVAYLLDKTTDPATLASSLSAYVGKPYLQLAKCEPPNPNVEAAYVAVYAQARQIWREQSVEISEALLGCAGLNRRSYPEASLSHWLSGIARMFAVEEVSLELAEKLDKLTASALAKGMKKNAGDPPSHPFFNALEPLLEWHAELIETLQQQLVEFKLALIDYLREELPKRQRQRQQQSFDALLTNLQSALYSEQAEALRQRLTDRYPLALIDEFQDTDPVQFDIFRRLYVESGRTLFWVGDPKQAIYSFRGADIFTYLQAGEQAERRYTLQTNWRSQPPLVSALNRLFQRVDKPFLYGDIEFYGVAAADKSEVGLQIAGEVGQSLQFCWLNGDEERLNKEQAAERVSEQIAGEIARLLQLAADGQASLNERPLQGGDIAVLVRTHLQADQLREALLRRGIASVQHSKRSVFESQEALELERLLLAISQPGREAWLRAALATRLCGFSANDLERLSVDEALWELQQLRFHDYLQLWRERGFIHAMRHWMQQSEVAPRLLSLADGERALTNLRHLIELLQQQSVSNGERIEPLLQWFARHRDGQYEVDAHQLRLESDANLVQIVTIHKSKGLEYGLLFAPFLWEAKGRTPQNRSSFDVLYHAGEEHQLTLALAQPKGSEAVERYNHEALAEELRLLYVALTRAKYRCYLPWGKVNGAELSAAAYLLHRQAGVDEPFAAAQARYKSAKAGAIRAELELLVASMGEGVGLIELSGDPQPLPPASAAAETLQARRFTGRLASRWRVSSYSSLFGHGRGLVSAEAQERPDYDAESWLEPPPSRDDRFGFPRGARAGEALHAMLERLDFCQPLAQETDQLIADTLQLYRFEERWQPVVRDWLEELLATPLALDGSLRLNELTPAQRLNELEFYFPLHGLTLTPFRRLLKRHGSALERRLAERLGSDWLGELDGFMKGFIDLVFEYRGRYYLLDYKSNYLGEEAGDYATERLEEAMLEQGYVAQYLIYSLALHRYLGSRVADYAYQQHFGGVYYLFLRGMQPEVAGSGCYFARPDEALMMGLDRLFDGEV